MKVTKAQAQANRAHIVATASALFRERGYDGVGVAELMAAAGFTHGGFYKHFGSKADLMAEAAATRISQAVAKQRGLDLAEFFRLYVSRAHRDARARAARWRLSAGTLRVSQRTSRRRLPPASTAWWQTLGREVATLGDVDQREARAKMIDTLAHAVGAVVLSRACPDDSPLADEILEVCRRKILASLSPARRPASDRRRSRHQSISRSSSVGERTGQECAPAWRTRCSASGTGRRAIGHGGLRGDLCWRASARADRRHAGFRANPHGAWGGRFPGAAATPALQSLGHGAWRLVRDLARLGSRMRGAFHFARRKGYTTLELKINMVRPFNDGVPLVRAEGKVIHAGRQVATAEGRIVGPDGKLYAHATTTCLIFDHPATSRDKE